MKKAIKIFSILCAILVAVFTATFFNSYKVNAAGDEQIIYQNEKVKISQYEEETFTLFVYWNTQPNYDLENCILKVKDLSENEYNYDFENEAAITQYEDYTDFTFTCNDWITELIEYKIQTTNGIYSEYPETTEDTTLIGDIFTETTTLLQKVVNFFVTAISTIINLFWISGTGLTLYGKLFIIPAGFAVFYKVMKWIGKLIRIR